MGFGMGWPQSPSDELDMLRAQANMLQLQLDQIHRRIEELEQGGQK
jgi:hypothetical protein